MLEDQLKGRASMFQDLCIQFHEGLETGLLSNIFFDEKNGNTINILLFSRLHRVGTVCDKTEFRVR